MNNSAKSSKFYYLTFCFLYIALASSPFTVSYNRKFIRASRLTVDTAITFLNLTAIDWNPLTYSVVYSDSLPNITKSSAVIAIDDIHIYFRQGEQI